MQPMHRERIDSICKMAANAGWKIRDNPGSRVIVTCQAGARIEGDWIEELGRGDKIAVYEDVKGVVTSTLIDIEAIAAIGVKEPEMTIPPASIHVEQSVAPSRLDMTIASILLQAWTGLDRQFTYGDLRVALDQIEAGAGTGLAGDPKYDDTALDALHVAMMPHVDRVLLRLADKNVPMSILDMPMTIVANIISDEIRHDGALKILMREIGDKGWHEKLGDLPKEIGAIAGKVHLAHIRQTAKRYYKPFMARMQLEAMIRSNHQV